ncbi:hypothetical protein ACNQR7_30805 [Mycolicibacterium senegalense]|uniref:hypothetical protein n=1 Tax=Mycolicibacterium senegalense TaxID=1796 RepID=UPI003AAC645D
MPPVILTDDECDLLAALPELMIGNVVADPEDGVRRIRTGYPSGGYIDYSYESDGRKLTRFWYDATPAAGPDGRPLTYPSGRIMRWERTAVREVAISLVRLQKWGEAISEETRERSRAGWRAWRASPSKPESIAEIVAANTAAIAESRPPRRRAREGTAA